MKSAMPVKATNVVVGAMDDFLNRTVYQNFSERSNILQGDRIYDVDFMSSGDLNEAKLLGVVVEAIGLGIESDSRPPGHFLNSDIKMGKLTDNFDG